ncbi:hypothetical protein LZ30DRAFT_797851 [Colletotrichum cereale]|nr:hypothetical protein LZ30DRAFT_797851 [Colletotrichum cereale]
MHTTTPIEAVFEQRYWTVVHESLWLRLRLVTLLQAGLRLWVIGRALGIFGLKWSGPHFWREALIPNDANHHYGYRHILRKYGQARALEPVGPWYCRRSELGCPILVGYQHWDGLVGKFGNGLDNDWHDLFPSRANRNTKQEIIGGLGQQLVQTKAESRTDYSRATSLAKHLLYPKPTSAFQPQRHTAFSNESFHIKMARSVPNSPDAPAQGTIARFDYDTWS